MHHPEAVIDRLYGKRKARGKGLLQIEVAHKAKIISTAEYLNTKYKEDHQLCTGNQLFALDCVSQFI
jgi:hypothetical protein